MGLGVPSRACGLRLPSFIWRRTIVFARGSSFSNTTMTFFLRVSKIQVAGAILLPLQGSIKVRMCRTVKTLPEKSHGP